MKKIGVYRIHCIPSTRSYIGSSIDITTRWRSHRYHLKNGIHHSPDLQADWERYGEAAFKFEVIEEARKSELPLLEDHYIQAEDNPYNTREDTDNPMRNPETVAKNLKSRGDKQSGHNSSSAKFTPEQYQLILKALLTNQSGSQIAQDWGVSPSTLSAISSGKSHAWLRKFPEYEEMLEHRAKLKQFRNYSTPELNFSPIIEVPLEQKPQRSVKYKYKRITLADKDQEVTLDFDEWVTEYDFKPAYLKKLLQGTIPRYRKWRFVKYIEAEAEVRYI